MLKKVIHSIPNVGGVVVATSKIRDKNWCKKDSGNLF
jgi:hypothetical protein